MMKHKKIKLSQESKSDCLVVVQCGGLTGRTARGVAQCRDTGLDTQKRSHI